MTGWGNEPRTNDISFGATMFACAVLYGGLEWNKAGGILPPTHILAPALLAVAGAIAFYVMRGAR